MFNLLKKSKQTNPIWTIFSTGKCLCDGKRCQTIEHSCYNCSRNTGIFYDEFIKYLIK